MDSERRSLRLDFRPVKNFVAPPVLADVSLDLVAGEVHVLVGQNGSGDSTLIKSLAGFHEAHHGAAEMVDGQRRTLGDPDDVHGAGVRMLHQDLGLGPSRSAVDNLALGHGDAHSAAGARRRFPTFVIGVPYENH